MAQIKKKFIEDNAVDQDKVRLDNETNLRSRNSANNDDVDILKVDSSDRIVFASVPQITSDAVSPNDLVRKSQLDANLQGLKPKEAVRAATEVSVPLSGGAVLTVDNISLVNGDRVLLKSQTSASENGIYIVSGIGTAYSLTRSVDMDETTPVNEIQGAYVAVQEGDENTGKVFVQQGSVNTIGSDDIDFIYFNSNTGLIGGDGIIISGSNVSVDHDGEGLIFDGSQLALELEDASLVKSASGLKVGVLDVDSNISNGSITAEKLDPSIAGEGLAFNGSGMDVQVDSATIEIQSDTLQVKDLGISEGKLQDAAVSTDKLADDSVTADKINADVAGEGLSQNASGALDVQVDDDTLEISADTVQVKDAGISLPKLQVGDSQADASNIDATSLSLSSAFSPQTGTVSGGDTIEEALEKLQDAVETVDVPIQEGEVITLSSGDLSNSYIDLARTAKGIQMLVPQGGPVQMESIDYTVALSGGSGGVTRITFSSGLNGLLEAGDVVQIKYVY